MFKRIGVQLLLALFCVAFMTSNAMAQGTSAGMNGRITDPDGNGIASAAVDIVHEPSGSKRSVSTDAEGRFLISGLFPDEHTLVVTCPGYAYTEFRNADPVFDAALKLLKKKKGRKPGRRD
ncbi:MAG: carboxypeptidase regulatory-like domain-containing protein [Rhodobacteraceae bacterium]|nr:carboxypeptidase regulatory-like domain-containing protein [Paracoccaceae bacterium]